MKYLPINWENGMKITRDHLTGHDRWIADAWRDTVSTALDGWNYGLLPAGKNGGESLKLSVQADQLVLEHCQAITPTGARIYIGASGMEPVSYPLERLRQRIGQYQESARPFRIYVVYDPEDLAKTGTPDPGESPPRYPYAMPKVRLELEEEVGNEPAAHSLAAASGFLFQVGRLEAKGASFALDDRFVPACTRVDCSPILLKWHGDVCNFLQEILDNAVVINSKIRPLNLKTELQNHLKDVIEQTALFLSGALDEFRILYPRRSPLHMTLFLMRFNRHIESSMRLIVAEGSLLRYFHHFTNITPADYKATSARVKQLEYDQEDVSRALLTIQPWLTSIVKIFRTLAGLEMPGKEIAKQ